MLSLALLAAGLAGCSTVPPTAPVAEQEPRAYAAGPPAPNPAPVPTLAPWPAATQLAPEPSLAPPPGGPPDLTSPQTSRPAETWVPLSRWCATNGCSSLTRLAGAPQPTYVMQTRRGALTLRAGSQIAQWNGLELRLGFAPQMLGGQPCLHGLDLRKTLQPLFNATGFMAKNGRPVLVLDPGHGGEDAGTHSVLDGHTEKEFTLDWALRVRRFLATNGWQVYLTRSNDASLALSNRVSFAEARQADLFLSLHFNSAAPNHQEAGLETYCLTPAGMPSNLTRGFGDDPALSFPNNAFDLQNLELALDVHRALLQVNGHHDRGVRRARFPGVLRGQNRPAVLVEGGYLSNPREAGLIADPAYRQKLAEALARALLASVHSAPATQAFP